MAIMWHTKSIREVADLLETDLSSGLSRRAALLRFKRDGENNIFKLPDTSFKHNTLSLAHGFSFLLLFLVIAIAAFANNGVVSGAASVIYVVFIAAVTIAYTWAKNVIYRAAERSIPRVRVLRDSVERYIDMRGVVRGDVISLKAGDIAPCDIYLAEADENLKVLEGRVTGARMPSAKQVCVIDDENAAPQDKKNIIFAGSIIRVGTCRGIAVEVGRSTAVVLKSGEISLYGEDEPPLTEELRDFSSKIGFRLLLIAIFVMVIGFFRHSGGEGLFEYFFTASVLCAAVVSEFPDIVFSIISAASISRGMAGSAPHLIKNVSAIENIASLNTLVVKSDMLMSGGEYDVSAMCTADETLGAENAGSTRSRGMRYLFECAAISAEYIAADYKEAKKSHCENALCADGTFAFLNGIIGNNRHYGTVMSRCADESFAFDTAVLQGSKSAFAVVSGNFEEILDSCNRYIENGQIAHLDSSVRARILSFAAERRSSGCRVIAYARNDFDYEDLSHADGIHKRMQFIGAIALRKIASEESIKFLDKCRRSGIKTVILHDSSSAEIRSLITTVPGYENAKLIDGAAFTGIDDDDRRICGYDIYSGLSQLQKEKLVLALSASGRRVGVYAESFDDYRMMFASDVSFTPGIKSDFVSDPSQGYVEDTRCKAVLRGADVIVARDIKAFDSVIRHAKDICHLSGAAVRYMSLMLAFRCFVIIFGALFGIEYLSPAQLLFLSLMTDCAAVAVAAFTTTASRDSARIPRVTFRYWHEMRSMVGAAVSGALLSVLVPLAFSVVGHALGEYERTGFVFLLSTALSVYYILVFMGVSKNKTVISVLSAICASCALVTVIPPLAPAFGTSLSLKVIIAFAVSLFVCIAVDRIVSTAVKKSDSGNRGKA